MRRSAFIAATAVAAAGLTAVPGHARAATLPQIDLPAVVKQGATVRASVDPRQAAACSLVVRRGRHSAARRLPGGAPYRLQLRVASRAPRARWSLAVRCDRTLSMWSRVRVVGKRRGAGRTLFARIKVKALQTPSVTPVITDPSPTVTAAFGPDEQGFVPSPFDTQDGEWPEDGELGAGAYDNARIADIALSELGRKRTTPGPIDHGQCKQSVNDWVAGASGGTQRLGGNYHSNYAAQGGRQVGRDQAVKGDIIQLHNPANERSYFSGMHTAVVVAHAPGSESFDVVDSNWGYDGIVRRHAWNPYQSARRYGLVVTIWRMGTVNAPPPPVSNPTPPPATTPPTAPPPPPQPSVSLSKGGSAQGRPGCSSSACRFLNVSFGNFSGGNHTITCRSSAGGEGGWYTYTRSGPADASAVCYFGYPGRTVWVTVDGVSSNHVVW